MEMPADHPVKARIACQLHQLALVFALPIQPRVQCPHQPRHDAGGGQPCPVCQRRDAMIDAPQDLIRRHADAFQPTLLKRPEVCGIAMQHQIAPPIRRQMHSALYGGGLQAHLGWNSPMRVMIALHKDHHGPSQHPHPQMVDHALLVIAPCGAKGQGQVQNIADKVIGVGPVGLQEGEHQIGAAAGIAKMQVRQEQRAQAHGRWGCGRKQHRLSTGGWRCVAAYLALMSVP